MNFHQQLHSYKLSQKKIKDNYQNGGHTNRTGEDDEMLSQSDSERGNLHIIDELQVDHKIMMYSHDDVPEHKRDLITSQSNSEVSEQSNQGLQLILNSEQTSQKLPSTQRKSIKTEGLKRTMSSDSLTQKQNNYSIQKKQKKSMLRQKLKEQQRHQEKINQEKVKKILDKTRKIHIFNQIRKQFIDRHLNNLECRRLNRLKIQHIKMINDLTTIDFWNMKGQLFSCFDTNRCSKFILSSLVRILSLLVVKSYPLDPRNLIVKIICWLEIIALSVVLAIISIGLFFTRNDEFQLQGWYIAAIVIFILGALFRVNRGFIELYTVSNLIDEHKEQLGGSSNLHNYIWELGKLFLRVIYMSHIIGILYHSLALFEHEILQTNDWLSEVGKYRDPWYIRYIESFYWSLGTVLLVGSRGDTPLETIFCCVTLLITVAIFATILSKIQMILNEIDQENKNQREDKRLLKELFARNPSIQPETRGRLLNFLKQLYKGHSDKNSNDKIEKILKEFPDTLQMQVKQEKFTRYIQEMKFFTENFSKETVESLISIVEEEYFMPNQVIIEDTDYSDPNFEEDPKIYMIIKGSAVIQQKIISDKSLIKKHIEQVKIQHEQEKIMRSVQSLGLQNNLRLRQCKIEENQRKKKEKNIEQQHITHQNNIIYVDQRILIADPDKNKYDIFGQLSFFEGRNATSFTCRSTDFSTILTIKRSKFVQILNSRDKELLHKFQHQIMTTQRCDILDQICNKCERTQHIHLNCNLIHYSPNKSNLIMKSQISHDIMERTKYKRSKKEKQNTYMLLERMKKCRSKLLVATNMRIDLKILQTKLKEDEENSMRLKQMKRHHGKIQEQTRVDSSVLDNLEESESDTDEQENTQISSSSSDTEDDDFYKKFDDKLDAEDKQDMLKMVVNLLTSLSYTSQQQKKLSFQPKKNTFLQFKDASKMIMSQQRQSRLSQAQNQKKLTLLTPQISKEIKYLKRYHAFMMAFEKKQDYITFFPENNFKVVLQRYKKFKKYQQKTEEIDEQQQYSSKLLKYI